MANDASETNELPDIDQLLQAVNILKACTEANNDPDGDIDLSYPMWAAVSLLEEASDREIEGYTKLIEASCIVKASIVTYDSDSQTNGFNWDLSWPLWAAIRLIDEVAEQLAKQEYESLPARELREIKIDPACASQFHRLLVSAARLPLAELERLARYAEIELIDGKKPRPEIQAAPGPTERGHELRP
jgi:hypothetical protein